MSSTSFFKRRWNRFLALMKNEYFWGGLLLLVVVAGGAYLLVDAVLMPSYTRHDAAITVPDVKAQPFEEAARVIREQNLEVERVATRDYNPQVPRNAVVDQTPPPSSKVKPGRRIYLTVNSGRTPTVQIPSVEGMSLRQAVNRIRAVGLTVKDTRPDSIPSPYTNTVTRQKPAPGDSLKEGSGVTLWYSTGLGDEYVEVPDVTGLPVDSARQQLFDRKLRSVVVRPGDTTGTAQPAPEDETQLDGTAPPDTVVQQSREAGTRVRAGFEVRLYLQDQRQATENGAAP